MSDLPPDVVARGRAIFERLRGAAEDDAPSVADESGPEVEEPPIAGDRDGDAADAVDRPVEPPSVLPAGADEAGDGRSAEPSDEQPAEPPGERPATDPTLSHATVDEAGSIAEAPPAAAAAPEAAEDAMGPAEPAVAASPSPAEDPEWGAIAAPGVENHAETTAAEPLPAAELPVLEGIEAAPPEPDDEADLELSGPVAPPPNRFARPLPRVLAVANQKGGVGKTTTTVNLAACLADLGHRVLVVDLDPQGNASTGLGINIRDLATSMYDVLLHDAAVDDCIEPTSVRNLFVAPSNLDLAGAEIELVPAFSRELKLRSALATVRDDFDYVLVDCPPSLGLLTVNSLAAASEVLVPIQCEYYALEGLGQLMRNVALVQKSLNPGLEVSVIVCVMYDARTKLADQVVQEVRAHFGEKVCRTVIPRTVRLSEAPSYGQPISAFDPTSRGAIAYRELAKEVSGGGTAQRAG